MSNRAVRKKLVKKFKVGDVVTWGNRVIAHRVVVVAHDGVWVDSTSAKYGTLQKDGTRRVFIPFVPYKQYGGLVGPPEHTTIKPGQPKK